MRAFCITSVAAVSATERQRLKDGSARWSADQASVARRLADAAAGLIASAWPCHWSPDWWPRSAPTISSIAIFAMDLAWSAGARTRIRALVRWINWRVRPPQKSEANEAGL